MTTVDYPALAKISYETALFYAKAMNQRISYLSRQAPGVSVRLASQCQQALRETEKEMISPLMKDDFYTASIRKWFNIVLFERVNSDVKLENQASQVLEEAYKMRSLHEAAFLAETLDCDPDFNASRRAFVHASQMYDQGIPRLHPEALD